MPTSIQAISTSNGYTEAATLGPFEQLATVQFTIANASVAAQVAKLNEKDNSLHWDDFETTFAPGTGGFSGKIYGVRFRSLVAGTPAVIIVNGYFTDDPIPFSSPQPFNGELTPGGGFVPTGGILLHQADYADTVIVPPFTVQNAPWTLGSDPDGVLDLTNPLLPTATMTGLYIVELNAFQSAESGAIGATEQWSTSLCKGAPVIGGRTFRSPHGDEQYENSVTGSYADIVPTDILHMVMSNQTSVTLTFVVQQHVSVVEPV